MYENIKKQALRRLNLIKGQVEGLKKMMEKDKYCIDILIQSMAVKQALSSLEDLILENHFREHIPKQMKNKKEAAVKELLKIYKLAKRK
jgi:DNA-binding FrmR family transcriptional regulator